MQDKIKTKTAQEWHDNNTELGRRQTYNRAGSAKKRGFEVLAMYYKALADAKFADEKENEEEVRKNIDIYLPLVFSAFAEYQAYVQEHGEMA